MKLTGKKIAVLLAEGVEDLEFYVPLMRLQEEGADVLAAGLDLKPIHGKNGLKITPTVSIESLNSNDLFALVVPGGWVVVVVEVLDVVVVVDVPGGSVGRRACVISSTSEITSLIPLIASTAEAVLFCMSAI